MFSILHMFSKFSRGGHVLQILFPQTKWWRGCCTYSVSALLLVGSFALVTCFSSNGNHSPRGRKREKEWWNGTVVVASSRFKAVDSKRKKALVLLWLWLQSPHLETNCQNLSFTFSSHCGLHALHPGAGKFETLLLGSTKKSRKISQMKWKWLTFIGGESHCCSPACTQDKKDSAVHFHFVVPAAEGKRCEALIISAAGIKGEAVLKTIEPPRWCCGMTYIFLPCWDVLLGAW